MLDTNGKKFKTHKFSQQNTKTIVCDTCRIKIKFHKYINVANRYDFYIGSWYSNNHDLEDIQYSCDEYIIKNIIE